jgi:predicted glycoside hydrolase/deacetylase ChbG (UPF0249 family)
MSTSTGKTLIVNADDFGMSPGINAGIIQAHQTGIVTSTSLMVRWPAAEEAARLARQNPRLSVGLHIDLGEWQYRNGDWSLLYAVLPPGREKDSEAVASEIAAQIARFRELLGRDPTHLDSHQHVHREEPAQAMAKQYAATLAVPLRHFASNISYCGSFYGQGFRHEPYPQGIEADSLCQILRELPTGISELACHPASCQDFESVYSAERERELASLCNPRVRRTVEDQGIRLASFLDYCRD